MIVVFFIDCFEFSTRSHKVVTFIIKTVCNFMANDKTNRTKIQIAVIIKMKKKLEKEIIDIFFSEKKESSK